MMALAELGSNVPNPEYGGASRVEDFLAKRVQAKKNAKLAFWVKQQYEVCNRQRQKQERQWYLNLAFLKGHHYVDWIKTASSSSGFKLWTPPAPPWRVRLVINKIRPAIRKEIAKLTSNKPNWTVVPNSTEDVDIIAAQVAEKIFTYLYDENRIQNKLKKTVFWSSSCGTGYIKAYWDKDKICGYGENEYQGEIVYEHLDPFHVFVPDLMLEEIEDQPYVIHAQTRSMQWVKSKFPHINVQPDVQAASGIIEDAYLNLSNAKNNDNSQVLILEMWIKPQRLPEHPNGAYILMVGDQIAQYIDEYPYDHKMYPFAKIDHIPSGQYYSTSVIEDLIPISREINRTRSQIVENKNMMGKLQFFYPSGSIDVRKVTNEPGQGIPFNPGLGPPIPAQPPNLPSYIIQHLDMLNGDFDDLSAQHEVSRGNAPGSVVAATAIGALQEQDDSQLSTTIDSIEDGIKKLGQLSLGYVEQFWDTERLVKVTSVDSFFDVQVYKGSAIRGNKDVRVEAGSALSVSKAAKQAFIMDLMNNQHIPPQAGLEVLEFPGVEKLYENMQIDIRQASRENLKMAAGEGQQQPKVDPMTGQPVPMVGPDGQPVIEMDPMTGQPTIVPEMETVFPPNQWDNHELHIEIHNKFRKGQQYEILPDEIKAIFELHVTLHQEAIMLAQMQMAPALPPGEEGGQEVSQDQANQYNDPNQPTLPGT